MRTTRPPTVDELSSIAGMSVRTLNRQIGKACGMSPQALLTRSRLLFAAAILHVTRMSVVQTAETAGFADASSLSHSMAKHFGWRCGELREPGSFPSFVQSLRTRYPLWLAYELDAP
jgi:transcriptional regulator GlxA family with amidase domain